MPSTLAEWLEYQLRIHPQSIALGLDRVREVWRRLGAPPPAPLVVAVGGTNGKGSTVAFLEAIYTAAGKRVGAYTSPHLLRYNERARIAGVDVEDAAWVSAFERIEHARQNIALTYFEFGTLAALWLFAQAQLDVAVLEVGLGGRLDAVNLVDADAAVVTTVDLDHQEWLGNDRDSIGHEKAGIFRRGRPAVVGSPDAPAGLLDALAGIGARGLIAGRDYHWQPEDDRWRWHCDSAQLDLPLPELPAPVQLANAAAAIAVVHALRRRGGWNEAAIAQGVCHAHAAARLQRVAYEPEVFVDVAHNPQAARALAQWLSATPIRGRNLAVFGALGDKDVGGIAAALEQHIERWFLAALDADSPRGLSLVALQARLPAGMALSGSINVAAALDAAIAVAQPGDRIIAFGSFFVAAAALTHLSGNAS
ncbi:bifunctional tetrahydrofolate synthase/dihydrofolate synthase [Dokdonella sp.]|uniref:bifunctional tetrahydrofolate synthase/dihydrofolate synthase n=1 Tax=Dokdonella sp. TaxID=2291710 RepID=UPI0025BBB2A8|nr:bifunctional tetrahydrofolate synthase/dihydrofolate synthase [Dokdonella sp.]MBX3690120.1 bifunctional tetrahydrofolate synthase/dihydrofolate synthase [Dokdonella sp.]